MKKLAAIAAPLLLTTGCWSSDVSEADEREWRTSEQAIEERNRMEEEAAREVHTEGMAQLPLADGLEIRPGQWHTTARLENIPLPGQSGEVRGFLEGLAAQTANSMSFDRCVTPEEAARPVPATFGPQSTDCVHGEFSMVDGAVRIVSHCENSNGHVADFEMTGTYGATSGRLDIGIDLNSPGIGAMRFAGETTSRHVSDTCS